MDDLAELVARFGERVKCCQHCGCAAVWVNDREHVEHEAACLKIAQAIEMEKSRQRQLAKKTRALKKAAQEEYGK